MIFALQAFNGNSQIGNMFSEDTMKLLLPLMMMNRGSALQFPFMQAPVATNISEVIDEEDEEATGVPINSSEVLEQLATVIGEISETLKQVNGRLDKLETNYE